MSYLIDQHLSVLRAEGMSPLTITSRRRCLRRLHDDLPHGILYACTEQLQAWLGYEKWARWTRYTYTGHVLEFYRWLHATRPDMLPTDPTGTMRRPKPPASVARPATDEQLQVVLTAPEPLLTAVILAGWAGLRRCEIARAHREDITEHTITIPVAKGGDSQTVPTHPAVWEHVRDRPAGPLVVDQRGDKLTAEQLGRLVRRWCRSAGLLGWGLHRLRHRYGTLIQREYRDLRVTQECLRHKSVTSTQIYTQVTDEQRRAAVRALPWIGHRPAGPGPVSPASTD